MSHPMLDLTAWDEIESDPSVVIANGQTVSIGVQDGCLVIKDGPRGERKRVYAKVPRVLSHVMILGSHGYLSLEAQRWMDNCGVSWTQFESEYQPRPIGMSVKYVNPALMRKQAMCATGLPLEGTGLAIARAFITAKLEGQAWVAEHMLAAPLAAKAIGQRVDAVAVADSTAVIGGLEGDAAKDYWSAWKGLRPNWRKPAPVKPHWMEYPVRRSLRRNYEDNRGATDPVNALLNYAYKVAESECAFACYAVGLSPAIGISHVDRKYRDSLALDLIEVIRPVVDEIVLRIITGPGLDRRMFTEGKDGIVTIEAPLTHRVAVDVHKAAYRLTPHVAQAVALLEAVTW